MGYLKLPEILRDELAREYGTILSGSPHENALKAIEHIREIRPPKVVVVGDFTLKALMDAGFLPDLAVFDSRTRRSGFEEVGLRPTKKVANPPGTITDDAVQSIGEALASERPYAIHVEGEEDLLALPAILLSPIGSIVLYGMPGKGMVMVEASIEMKEKVKALISRFERIDDQNQKNENKGAGSPFRSSL